MNSHHHQPLNHPKTWPPLDTFASNSPFDMLRGSASTSISGIIFGDPAGVCDKNCYQITDSFKFQAVEVLLERWEAHKFFSNMCNNPARHQLGTFFDSSLGRRSYLRFGRSLGSSLGRALAHFHCFSPLLPPVFFGELWGLRGDTILISKEQKIIDVHDLSIHLNYT